MRVYLYQMDMEWESKEQNFNRVRSFLDQAKVEADSLVVLPEMFATGFSMDAKKISEPSDGPTTSFLRQMCRDYHVWIIAGLAVQSNDVRYNQAIIISPEGDIKGRYNKNYPFSFANEDRHYKAGDNLELVSINGFNVSPIICYDLRFPELFRKGVQQGAELFVVIANWPARRVDHWTTLIQARAIENQAWVIGLNRAGSDPDHTYPGRSLIVDPHGVTRLQFGHLEDIQSMKLDHSLLKDWRESFPALNDIKS